jgi:hypothetical protein
MLKIHDFCGLAQVREALPTRQDWVNIEMSGLFRAVGFMYTQQHTRKLLRIDAGVAKGHSEKRPSPAR